MNSVNIRRFELRDVQSWNMLWESYNVFYKRTVETRTSERVWSNLVSGKGEPFGYAAILGDRVVGFSHYFFVPSTSDWTPRCYMQDLFTDGSVRGRGVGSALIKAVYAHADSCGASQTYWLTQTSNESARKLYDRVATPTEFMKYRR